MAAEDCPAQKRTRESVAALAVRDVMIPRPKTLPVTARVADVRTLFGNRHVRSAILVDGDAFVAMIDREGLPADAPDERPALPYATRELTSVRPDDPMTVAMQRLDAARALRLVVLDNDGSTLRGLLCLNGQATGFCG
jgi:CBS domain-containing protein